MPAPGWYNTNCAAAPLCWQLWHSYFTLSVTFATQTDLQLEDFTEVKREKLLHTYQDMRMTMGFELLAMWRLLGGFIARQCPASRRP